MTKWRWSARWFTVWVGATWILAAPLSVVVLAQGGNARAQSSSPAQPTHQMTIYVDEGVGQTYGHVFVELSDGRTKTVRGFYPDGGTFLGQLAGFNESQVGNDAGHDWDVKQTYNITVTGYKNALRTIEDFRGGRRDWSADCYCGTFAEEVARAAGVPIQLPVERIDADARPELFGRYLRQRGGVVNPQKTGAQPVVQQPQVSSTTVVDDASRTSERTTTKTQTSGSSEDFGTPKFEYDPSQLSEKTQAARTLNEENTRRGMLERSGSGADTRSSTAAGSGPPTTSAGDDVGGIRTGTVQQYQDTPGVKAKTEAYRQSAAPATPHAPSSAAAVTVQVGKSDMWIVNGATGLEACRVDFGSAGLDVGALGPNETNQVPYARFGGLNGSTGVEQARQRLQVTCSGQAIRTRLQPVNR